MKSFILLFFALHIVYGEQRKYLIPNFQANWFKANEFCRSIDMALVTVQSEVKHNQLIKFIKKSDKFSDACRFWIGASDLADEGVFTWAANASLVTFTSWGPGEPNNGNNNEHCVELIHHTGADRIWKWNDNNCREFATYFVCESVDDECIQQF